MRNSIFIALLAMGCGEGSDLNVKIEQKDADCTWYTDADGDGYADPFGAVDGDCEAQPDGTMAAADGLWDCDDTSADNNPDADEVCDDELDNDCDGDVDEGCDEPDDTGETGDDTGETGDDTGETGDDTGETGDDTGETGDDTGETGDDTGETDADADDTGSTGEDTGDAGTSEALYPECSADADCSEGQFCGIECWTGGCGADGSVPSPTLGNYCQPCDECEADTDAVSGSCDACGGATGEDGGEG